MTLRVRRRVERPAHSGPSVAEASESRWAGSAGQASFDLQEHSSLVVADDAIELQVGREGVDERPDPEKPGADHDSTEDGGRQRDLNEPGDAGAALEDGRHASHVHRLDVHGRTITVDVVQFLTGQAATEAYRRAHPEDPDGPPNDYYIVNVNRRLRTLPVASHVAVQLVRLHEGGGTDLDPGTWEELPSYLDAYPTEDARLSPNPFWITIGSGDVTAIEEQYLP
jgi:hypothetical protein